MQKSTFRSTIKSALGKVPGFADFYWRIRGGGPPPGGFSLKEIGQVLAEWVEIASEVRQEAPSRKSIFIFAMTRQWISQAVLTGLGLYGLGYDVSLGFLPNLSWKEPGNIFDRKRQKRYIKQVLKPAYSQLQIISLADISTEEEVPEGFKDVLQAASMRDVKYALMREDVDRDHDLYRLRYKRNGSLAGKLFPLFKQKRPDLVLVPNGSVLEFGIVFQVARALSIPVVSYEFGEQTNQIWLAQNEDVMRQRTDDLWEALGGVPLCEAQKTTIRELISARRGGDQWNQFSRQWQKVSSRGSRDVREELGLDDRPVVLLPTNVLGDSLTLGREVFSSSMTEWIVETINHFYDQQNVQLIVRIHPGEQLSWGPSVYEILEDYFDELPEHIHVIKPTADVNSYDLIDLCSLAVVFTTTLGMEVALSGKPVVVVGETHYKGKGFTHDPDSWSGYFKTLHDILEQPEEFRLSEAQTNLAWRYAYRFFFDYPFPFPWHVQHYQKDLHKWPINQVLDKQGIAKFGHTFHLLAGAPLSWKPKES